MFSDSMGLITKSSLGLVLPWKQGDTGGLQVLCKLLHGEVVRWSLVVLVIFLLQQLVHYTSFFFFLFHSCFFLFYFLVAMLMFSLAQINLTVFRDNLTMASLMKIIEHYFSDKVSHYFLKTFIFILTCLTVKSKRISLCSVNLRSDHLFVEITCLFPWGK